MLTSQTVPVFWGWIGAGVARQSGKTLILNGKDDGEDARYCGTKKREQQVFPGRWVKEMMSLQWTKWTKETSLGGGKKKNLHKGTETSKCGKVPNHLDSRCSLSTQVTGKLKAYGWWWCLQQRPSLLPISVCRDKVTQERSLLVMYSSSAKASLSFNHPTQKNDFSGHLLNSPKGIQNQYDSECREKVMCNPVEASNSGASCLQNGLRKAVGIKNAVFALISVLNTERIYNSTWGLFSYLKASTKR